MLGFAGYSFVLPGLWRFIFCCWVKKYGNMLLHSEKKKRKGKSYLLLPWHKANTLVVES